MSKLTKEDILRDAKEKNVEFEDCSLQMFSVL